MDILKQVKRNQPNNTTEVLDFISRFLRTIASASSKNEMTMDAIAHALGPAICRPKHGAYMSIKHMSFLRDIRQIVLVLLSNVDAIFVPVHGFNASHDNSFDTKSTSSSSSSYNWNNTNACDEVHVVDTLISSQVDGFFKRETMQNKV